MASNITPGTQQYGELEPAIGKTCSVTQDPLTPVEYGRTAAGSKYETSASNGAEIPDQSTTAPEAPDTVSAGGGTDTVY